jgi:hypothetical protein
MSHVGKVHDVDTVDFFHVEVASILKSSIRDFGPQPRSLCTFLSAFTYRSVSVNIHLSFTALFILYFR